MENPKNPPSLWKPRKKYAIGNRVKLQLRLQKNIFSMIPVAHNVRIPFFKAVDIITDISFFPVHTFIQTDIQSFVIARLIQNVNIFGFLQNLLLTAANAKEIFGWRVVTIKTIPTSSIIITARFPNSFCTHIAATTLVFG